jgi:hypothetical protein
MRKFRKVPNVMGRSICSIGSASILGTTQWNGVGDGHAFSSHGQAFAAVRVVLTQALRSSHMSADSEASRHAWIRSPPSEPLVLVLWLNQVTRWFCGESPQTPRVDSGREPLTCNDFCPRHCLAFLATMRPALDPTGC